MLTCILHYYIFPVVNIHQCMIQYNVMKIKYLLLIKCVICVNSFVKYTSNVTFYAEHILFL